MNHSPHADNPPHRTAAELTRLAAESTDPAERLWYLQWAKAFSELAAFGAGGDEADHANEEDFDD